MRSVESSLLRYSRIFPSALIPNFAMSNEHISDRDLLRESR